AELPGISLLQQGLHHGIVGRRKHVGDLHSVIRFLRDFQQRRRIQRKLPDPAQLQELLAAWLKTPLGERLLKSEKAQLAPVLSRIFGSHILQVSSSRDVSLLEESRVGHKFVFSPVWREDCKQPVADAEALPLVSGSVDAVLLKH